MSKYSYGDKMIILVGGVKGGSGKSTIATNLAVSLAYLKHDVLMVDTDNQQTTSNWHQRRVDDESNNQYVIHCERQSGRIIDAINDKSKRYQDIIIDAGGYDSVELRSALMIADVIVAPVQPSQADLETFGNLNELVENANAMRPGVIKSIAVISRAPTHHLVTETEEAQEFLDEHTDFSLADQVIHDRKVYRDAMYEGKGVIELSNDSARLEILTLSKNIIK